MSEKRLPCHEWVVVVLLIVIFIISSIIIYIRDQDSLSTTKNTNHHMQDELQITIQGQVLKPATYKLKRGASMAELLALAEPLPEADLSRIKNSRKLKPDEIITIPAKAMITVFVEGYVERVGFIEVPKGTRINELSKYVKFLPVADEKKINKKRLLKDQEVIIVPARKKYLHAEGKT